MATTLRQPVCRQADTRPQNAEASGGFLHHVRGHDRQAEYDLLATLIHLPVSNRQLVEDLLATRDSGIWRNRLTIEDIADLTRMSPRTVKRFV